MKKNELTEIKKGNVGTGLLIENDGYISKSIGKNQQLIESIRNQEEWNVPNPFIVDAVFQKCGIKNANGRIYPEDILKREIEKYQEKINERRALGECYTPNALILTETGWKKINDVIEGENIITLNTKTNEIELKPILQKIELEHKGNLINIKGENINDIVTPLHQYPLYNNTNSFVKFDTAENLLAQKNNNLYIPKSGIWNVQQNKVYRLRALKSYQNTHPEFAIAHDISFKSFMKFLGIYLANGEYKHNNVVEIYQYEKHDKYNIPNMLNELGLPYEVKTIREGYIAYSIFDPRLKRLVKKIGKRSKKQIPIIFKQQSKELLLELYKWFAIGNYVNTKRHYDKDNLIYSTSKQLILDLNEIQLKIGNNGNFITKQEGKKTIYYSVETNIDLIQLNDKISYEKIPYNDKVICVEVENHTFYVMDNGFTHWSKNCNHPAESTIDLGRVSHNIIELHWENNTVVGKLELFTSYGFRTQGIVSTLGDMVANLILSGYKIGVSSRGVGSVEQKLGQYVVGDDFELICWDIVSDPSTPGAWCFTDESDKALYVETTKTEKDLVIDNKIKKLKQLI